MALLATAVSILIPTMSWGDELVLRSNLKLKDKPVSSFDEDGVRFGPSARPISWDEIAGGTLVREQARFDDLRQTLGEPLFQLKAALREGNYRATEGPAESLYPKYAGRRSSSAYLVVQAVMWERLARHRSEEAIEPYLICLTLRLTVKDLGSLPARRHLDYDAKTGLCPELPLVGYDRERAAAALPLARARLRSLGETAPPGLRLYLVGLALAAGDPAVADAELAAMASPPRPLAEIAEALGAQAILIRGRASAALTRLEKLRATCLDINRPLIEYLMGTSRLASREGDPRDGVLDLLDVAASYGQQQPALAAVALYAAQKALGEQRDAASARSVQIELIRGFPETDLGARLLVELGPESAVIKAAAQLDAGEEKADVEAAQVKDVGAARDRPRPGAPSARKRLGLPKGKDRPR